MITVFMGVLMFIVVVTTMVVVLLIAKARLVPSGEVEILINEDKSLKVNPGSTLLSTLAAQKIFIPSACGGAGTCAQCKVQVTDGGGDILPTETGHINRGMARDFWRLACQVKVKQDMKINVPAEIFSIKKWECEVVSNRNVATFIKEFLVKLPEGETLDFKAGGYIQIDIPQHDIPYTEFDIEAEYKGAWERFKLLDIRSKPDDETVRAYSMANYPAEGNIVMLNVRIATPPFSAPPGTPTGVGSSYIFNCNPGDKVMISGPYGEFFIKDTNAEMCFIGGGAGMAPMRSHIMNLFETEKTKRKATYWYGARSLQEMFYQEDFDKIEKENDNFKWNIALSEPQPEDNWTGLKGFIHQVLLDEYLAKHEAPEEIEYYICGPPMMLSAVLKMLDDLGVESENILFDDFG